MFRKILISILAVVLLSQFLTYYMIGIGSGESMEPVIDSCDILVVDKTQDTISEVESGDIIAYESIDGNLIAHKFYTTAGLPNELKYIVAKGVNRSSVDRTPIYNEDLVGKVSRVYDLSFC